MHYRKPCLTCHGVARTRQAFRARLQAAGVRRLPQREPDQVVSKHASLQIVVVASDTASCLRCHPNGEPATNFNHVFSPSPRPTSMRWARMRVHLPGVIGCNKLPQPPAIRCRFDCTVCHDPNAQIKHACRCHRSRARQRGTALARHWGCARWGDCKVSAVPFNGPAAAVAMHARTPAQLTGFPIASGNHFHSCEQCHTRAED